MRYRFRRLNWFAWHERFTFQAKDGRLFLNCVVTVTSRLLRSAASAAVVVGLPHWAHVGHSTGPGAMSSSDAQTRSSSTSSGAMTRVPNDIGVATSCTATPAQPRSPGRNHPHPIHRAGPRSESDHTAPGGKTPLSDQHEPRLSRTAVFRGGHPGLWRRRRGEVALVSSDVTNVTSECGG